VTEPEDDKADHFYWPEGLIPITPQARRVGFQFSVYVTKTIWSRACSWTGPAPISIYKTSPDQRIFELLNSAHEGLQKRLAGSDEEDGFLYYRFKHFFWDKGRPKAKKKSSMKIGCRLFLHPDTQRPWMLFFDPDYDYESMLKKKEPNDET